nr:MAG TPA: hypothetical protein [Caudoviricetes sp.]
MRAVTKDSAREPAIPVIGPTPFHQGLPHSDRNFCDKPNLTQSRFDFNRNVCAQIRVTQIHLSFWR